MTQFIKPDEFLSKTRPEQMPESYRKFRKRQDIQVHTGLYVQDLGDLETSGWDYTGQQGAFINLIGMEGVDDLQIHDLEPGGQTKTLHHAYQEIVYVLKGAGVTVIGEGEDQTSFEWSKDALFVLPRNTPYRHINTAEAETTRLVCQTDLPQMLALTDDEEFIFDADYDFWARGGEASAFSDGTEGTMYENKYEGDATPITWEANFIPNIRQFNRIDTDSWSNLGAMKIIRIPFPYSNTHAHISEIPVGQYKNAHRHGPAANVFIHSGDGYTLMWKPEMDQKVKLEWGPRSVFTPPAGWYHHHFNLGSKPAGQFAMHSPPLGTLDDFSVFDPHMDENTIDYADEDPEIREHYQCELQEAGIDFRMPDECYTDPDHTF